MPKAMQFTKGSIIYFEGDRDDRIYIVQSGSVLLSGTEMESGMAVAEHIKNGEFFGRYMYLRWIEHKPVHRTKPRYRLRYIISRPWKYPPTIRCDKTVRCICAAKCYQTMPIRYRRIRQFPALIPLSSMIPADKQHELLCISNTETIL